MQKQPHDDNGQEMNEGKAEDTLPMGSSAQGDSQNDPAQLSTLIANHPPASEQQAFNQNQLSLIDNRFSIERELGRGGIGVVYLAIDKEDNNRYVVIKALLEVPDEQLATWVVQKFRAEVKALERINHPGVVKFIKAGAMPDGRPYLAMEFVEGKNLRSYIVPGRGIREFEQIADFIRQLGAAISAAHDSAVYHRDLKPENIMVDGSAGADQIKVIDFGISTVKDSLDEKTKTTMLAGSVRYMAPEQISGRPTAASDIFALGVIAYEMITGLVPFDPDLSNPFAATQQLLEMQRKGVRVLPKDLRPRLPERAQEIVLKALAYQPSARYQRADEFGRDLAKALTEEEAERVKRWKYIGAIVALLIVAALSLFAWNYFRNRAPRNSKANPSVEIREHRLSYWASAQKYKNNKLDGGPIRMFGSEMYFNTGDGIRFFITSSDIGHLYVLDEENSDRGILYNLLFPTPRANRSSSQIQANVEIATDESIFTGNSGMEKVWFIWSASPIGELEDEIERWKDENYLGEITDSSKVAFIKNLLENNSKTVLQIEQDEANKQMNLIGKTDIIVRRLSLAHR